MVGRRETWKLNAPEAFPHLPMFKPSNTIETATLTTTKRCEVRWPVNARTRGIELGSGWIRERTSVAQLREMWAGKKCQRKLQHGQVHCTFYHQLEEARKLTLPGRVPPQWSGLWAPRAPDLSRHATRIRAAYISTQCTRSARSTGARGSRRMPHEPRTAPQQPPDGRGRCSRQRAGSLRGWNGREGSSSTGLSKAAEGGTGPRRRAHRRSTAAAHASWKGSARRM